MTLLKQIRERYTVDSDRIYLMGHSMGGAGTYHLGAKYKDSIVPAAGSRRAAMLLQGAGAQHVYLEFPGKDHEFWIRRGEENLEKVFLFFATVSKRTTKGFITPDMLPSPPSPGRG